ncbi:shikimate kinase [Agaribacterium sp. ZY112]|uniref:shikimate kinase n=1 Tax=Agaribacterium sp. ZY112 TaxID=3233574 RepID=UPI003523ABFD
MRRFLKLLKGDEAELSWALLRASASFYCFAAILLTIVFSYQRDFQQAQLADILSYYLPCLIIYLMSSLVSSSVKLRLSLWLISAVLFSLLSLFSLLTHQGEAPMQSQAGLVIFLIFHLLLLSRALYALQIHSDNNRLTMTNTSQTNIILIGMPGSGKSTLGLALAHALKRPFIDSDQVIEKEEQCSLQQILDKSGYQVLRNIEEQYLLKLEASHNVIATGGSAIYSEEAMQHLKELGSIIYLELPLAILKKRITNFSQRGLARAPHQGLNELFIERQGLYERWADYKLDCKNLDQEHALEQLKLLVEKISTQEYKQRLQ